MILNELRPMNASFPPGYDANTRCEYKMGAPRHMVDNCKSLKHKVQDFINCKADTFTPIGPNVMTNPMSTHTGPSVNVIEESDSQELIEKVEEI